MKTVIVSTAVALSLAVSTSVWAGNWTVHETVFGVTVSNSKTGESYTATSVKTAKKQAKHLNKIEDKQAKKEGNGVWDDGSRACNDPNSTVLC
ncbi:MAG: hypothetical protein AAGB15_00400 [Pseudomonadota bacterium]